jgi:carbonic anhydrase
MKTLSIIIVIIILAVLLILSITACKSGRKVLASTHRPDEQVVDWQRALKYLEDGNRRFVDGKIIRRDADAEDRMILKGGQKPFAVIVTCSDSRVSPEIYFDLKLGDIFVIRNAGNIADMTTLGSLEYAVEHLKVPLVVVVGHSSCGAVNGAFTGGEFPENLQSIIDAIAPAIDSSGDLDEAIHRNVDHAVELIRSNEIVRHMGAVVMGAHYDIETGEVSFQ